MPPLPLNEAGRLAALRELRILDTAPEAHFNAVCSTAAALYSAPIAVITLIDCDRQWFKAKIGIDLTSISRDIAFCNYTIRADDTLIVEDATKDTRFAQNPLVMGETAIRFYAGAPLVLCSGFRLGTLCILDTKVRSFSNAQKNQLEDLARIVVAHIELHRERLAITAALADSKASEQRIAYMAQHDTLTGLLNRNVFYNHLKKRLIDVQRGDSRTALLCLDLNRLRIVNDTFGQVAGDDLLCQISSRIDRVVRDGDVIARLGGDEFAITICHSDHEYQASKLAQRIIDTVEQPFDIGGQLVTVGVSIGIALAPADGNSADSLFRSADMALYRAKAAARSGYCFYEIGMDAAVEARMQIEVEMREAVICGGFALHYQPVLRLADHKIVGFEALMRWPHSTRGMIAPDVFIPLAEQSGQIVPLGSWALQEACREAASWPSDLRIAVNVSAVQFQKAGLEQSVISALTDSGLAPHRLVLEITESVLVQDAEAVIACLHRLKSFGVCIALDDFGTGYSSLSYLRRFPFDTIKIDRSFIQEISDPGAAAIVRAVVGIATQLGAAVTAEGVETTDQLERLQSEGCTEVQGYLVSRPLSAEKSAEFIKSSSAIEHAYQKLCEADKIARLRRAMTDIIPPRAINNSQVGISYNQNENDTETLIHTLQSFMKNEMINRRNASKQQFRKSIEISQIQRRIQTVNNF